MQSIPNGTGFLAVLIVADREDLSTKTMESRT
jgi:hypothetical protein